MELKVVGAGLPRTGTASQRNAFETLLGGRCCHMSAIPGHPFNLGDGWSRALAGEDIDWGELLGGFVAAVDWPTSMFWRELSDANPNALVLLSVRDSAEVWWQSVDATILRIARMALASDWNEGRDLLDLLERFTGTTQWDDRDTLMEAYERHNADVRRYIPRHRLLEWNATEGWDPICQALNLPVPDTPFPWTNKRSDWG